MNVNAQQEAIERDVRMAMGDLTIQLIVARAQNADLLAQLEAYRNLEQTLPVQGEPAPETRHQGKVNGKAHPDATNVGDKPN